MLENARSCPASEIRLLWFNAILLPRVVLAIFLAPKPFRRNGRTVARIPRSYRQLTAAAVGVSRSGGASHPRRRQQPCHGGTAPRLSSFAKHGRPITNIRNPGSSCWRAWASRSFAAWWRQYHSVYDTRSTAFAVEVFAGCLTVLFPQLLLLLANPGQFADGNGPDGVEAQMARGRDAHPASRRVHAPMKILDILAHDIRSDIAEPRRSRRGAAVAGVTPAMSGDSAGSLSAPPK